MNEPNILRTLQRHCPQTWQRIAQKRYQLPDSRVASYANQLELINHFAKWVYLANTGTVHDEQADQQTKLLFVNQALALGYNRPTYFLKADHGAALMRTELPEDLTLEDIRWRHAQVRIMVPFELSRFRSAAGNGEAFVAIDLARLNAGETVRYPREIAAELDLEPALYRMRAGSEVELIEERKIHNHPTLNGIAMVLTYTRPHRDYFGPDHFGIGTYRLDWADVKSLLALNTDFEPTLERAVNQEVMRNRMLHLGLQCLLYMSREEEEIEEEVIRLPRKAGKNLISGIVRARFVDEYARKALPGQARVVASFEPDQTMITRAAHFVKGFWRRQSYGPANSLRKLIWIQPYFAQGNKEAREAGDLTGASNG
jgi:hypothetical protein